MKRAAKYLAYLVVIAFALFGLVCALVLVFGFYVEHSAHPVHAVYRRAV